MKSAARLVPSFRQVFRAPVAGPSRPALARFASTAAEPPAAPESAEPAAALPPNITFEDVSGARTAVGNALLERGERLHTRPADPFEPITHPLSSFTSLTPTQPAPSGEQVVLPVEVFGKPLRKDILHRNVVWYLSTLREGNQSTKTRSTVAYSGRKIRPQKGSGKARAGDKSSGTRRGGAPIHALKPRDWAQELPRKVRKLGLQTALSSKLSSGLLRIVKDLNEAGWEGTRDVVHALGDGIVEGENDETVFVQRFGPKKDLSILFVYPPHKDPKDAEAFFQRIRNIPNVEFLSTDELLAYDVLKYRWTILEAEAVDALAAEDEGFDFDFDPALEAQFEAQLAAAEAAEAAHAAQGAAVEPQVTKVDLNAAPSA